jgi:thioredoxin-related protein
MSSSHLPTAYQRFRQYAMLVIMAFVMSCGTVQAAELLVVGSPTCPYCKAWEIEVGSIYEKTAESKRASLRRVDIKRIETTPLVFKEPVKYTPTFILLDKDVEVGRIVGYSNEATFWGLLNELLTRLLPADSSFKPIKF